MGGEGREERKKERGKKAGNQTKPIYEPGLEPTTSEREIQRQTGEWGDLIS